MRLALLASLALTLAACDSGLDLIDVDVAALSHDPAALVGMWDLTTVTGSGYGSPPETTRPSYSERFTFREDGTVQIELDGEVQETTYDVRRLDYGNGTQSDTPYLFLGDRTERFGLDGDRLYLDSREVDGPLNEYERVRYVAL